MAEAEGKEVAATVVPSELKETVDNVVESALVESVNIEEETVMIASPEEEDAEAERKDNRKVESVGTDVPEGEKVDEKHKAEEAIAAEEVKVAEEVKADKGASASNKKTKKLRKVKKKAVAIAAASSDKTKKTSASAAVPDGKAKEEDEEEDPKENGKVESVGTDVPEGEKVDEEQKTKEAIAAEEVKADVEGISASNRKTKKLRKAKKKAVVSAVAPSDKTEEISAGAAVLDGKAKEKPNGRDQPGASTADKKKSKMADGMGLIFMCNAKTKTDCFHYKVLGLPANKKELVEKIYKGMRLFLFDVDLKLLYGIYKAASPGGYNLEPKAFKSGFPSQVRFTVLNDCLPLPEEKFKAAIKDNYYGRNKFNCQLSAEQVKNLCKLFSSAGKAPSSKKRSREATGGEPEPGSTGQAHKRRPQHERARKDRTPPRIRGHDLYSRREAYASPPPLPVAYVPSGRLAAVGPPPPPPSHAYDLLVDYRRELLPSVNPYPLYREPLRHPVAYAPYTSFPSASSYAPPYPRY